MATSKHCHMWKTHYSRQLFFLKKKITMKVKLFLKIRNDKVESTLFLKKMFLYIAFKFEF